jgi:hypothetical protein
MHLESMGHDSEVEVERYGRNLGAIKYRCGCSILQAFSIGGKRSRPRFGDFYNLGF